MTQADPTPPSGPRQTSLRLGDGAVSIAFLALGLYLTVASITRYQAFTQGQVGPGVLPLLIGLTMMLTSGLALLNSFRQAIYEEQAPNGPEFLRVLALLALIVACVALMPVLGAIVTLGVFVFLETAVLERRGWLVSVAAGLGIPTVLYFFFEVLLGVPLPAGMFGLI